PAAAGEKVAKPDEGAVHRAKRDPSPAFGTLSPQAGRGLIDATKAYDDIHVISYESEIEAAPLSPETAARLIAIQRREVFSLFPEVRALAWLGAMLVAGGVGVLLSHHLQQIGPVTIAIVIAMVAACCYAWAWLRRERVSLIDDSILLLGGMLVSADAG